MSEFILKLREDRPATIEEHAALRAEINRLRAALLHAESVMTIIPPRNDTHRYLACLDIVRAALGIHQQAAQKTK